MSGKSGLSWQGYGVQWTELEVLSRLPEEVEYTNGEQAELDDLDGLWAAPGPAFFRTTT
jgi:hypothetical protein